MTVLAIDTAFAACQVALLSAEDEVLYRESRAMQRGQAEVLPALLQAAFAAAGCRPAALGLVAVSIGPGSFTGVRVGVAAARGLALVAGCEVAGITTLEALAAMAPADAQRRGAAGLAVISARRGQVYAQPFRAAPRPRELGPPQVADLLGLDPLPGAGGALAWAAGDAAADAVAAGLATGLVPDSLLPAPESLARLAMADRAAGSLRPALPLYVRGPGAALPGGPA